MSRASVVAGERPSKSRWLATVIVGLLCAAPVPGDIGSCGQPVQPLDPRTFFEAQKEIDCQRCQSCKLTTETCATSCDDKSAVQTIFPTNCEPLVHDGEVCLRRLLRASCDEYNDFVADANPTVPTECDFCPKER